ncbi:MAG: septal ring lytic transglycosylase RlpA family protein [Gammaproteobacteria bacterium]
MYALSAARKTLPLLCLMPQATNLRNRRSVIVRVTDRGPFHGDREMDLSCAVARKLGIRDIEWVAITPIDPENTPSKPVKINKSG